MLDVVLRCGNQPLEHLANFLYLHWFVCHGGLLVEGEIEHLPVKPPPLSIWFDSRVKIQTKTNSKQDQSVFNST